MSSEAPVTFLTQDAYDRLADELERLSTTGREEITARIAAAREEGDLKENGGYHAAKDEQGKQEARIRTLQHLLKTATVSEAPASHGIVESGTVVTAIVAGGEEVFLLGNREIAANSELDVYSEASPARRRHPRPRRGREDVVHRAERPRDHRRGREGRDLRGSVIARAPAQSATTVGV